MTIDPYKILDVAKDATTAEVRKAYRKKSKTAHPNAGGKPEEWKSVSTALVVLSDPKRRQTYDETGRIEEPKPDNDRAAALGVVEEKMGTIINAFFQAGFDPALDPRCMNIPAKIALAIAGDIGQAKQALIGGRKIVTFLKDIEKRFKRKKGAAADDDPIVRGIQRQVEQNEQQLSTLEHQIRVHAMAIEIVQGYDFRWDQPQPETYTFSTTTGNFAGFRRMP